MDDASRFPFRVNQASFTQMLDDAELVQRTSKTMM
jgi:hypothetical protein